MTGTNARVPFAHCGLCGATVGVMKGGQLHLRAASRTVVVKADGVVETTCGQCKGRTRLPLAFDHAAGIPASVRPTI